VRIVLVRAPRSGNGTQAHFMPSSGEPAHLESASFDYNVANTPRLGAKAREDMDRGTSSGRG